MKKEMIMVRNADGEELFVGDDIGYCQTWCAEHHITGENGEYIAIGLYDENTRYFEIEDYCEIHNEIY